MIIILSLFLVFNVSAKDLSDIKSGLAKKVNDDDLFFDLFQLKIENSMLKIEQNMSQLKKVEEDLDRSIRTGNRDVEGCTRKGLSQLRTINYVYPWLFDQLDKLKDKKLRYNMFEVVARADFLNKTFVDMNIDIEQCVLNITEDRRSERELVKDIAASKVDVIKTDLIIKEFSGSKHPFR